MDPNYDPENVGVPDDGIAKDEAAAEEAVAGEEDNLKNDEAEEDSNYNAFEGQINEIQTGEKAKIDDTVD
jgi:hypothetical protein